MKLIGIPFVSLKEKMDFFFFYNFLNNLIICLYLNLKKREHIAHLLSNLDLNIYIYKLDISTCISIGEKPYLLGLL